MKEKLFFVLVIVALIMGPALADHVNPHNVVDATGFGTLEATLLDVTSPAGVFGFAITVDASVYLNNGVYTYVYALSDNETGTRFFAVSGIASVSIVAPDFDPALGWGTVGDVPSDLNVTFAGGLITFQFFPNLPSGLETFTVYAQSTMAPLLYPFSGVGFGPTGLPNAYTLGADPPTALPEAPSFFPLGMGLLVLGMLRQKFS